MGKNLGEINQSGRTIQEYVRRQQLAEKATRSLLRRSSSTRRVVRWDATPADAQDRNEHALQILGVVEGTMRLLQAATEEKDAVFGRGSALIVMKPDGTIFAQANDGNHVAENIISITDANQQFPDAFLTEIRGAIRANVSHRRDNLRRLPQEGDIYHR